jgi:hypothetical protein
MQMRVEHLELSRGGDVPKQERGQPVELPPACFGEEGGNDLSVGQVHHRLGSPVCIAETQTMWSCEFMP